MKIYYGKDDTFIDVTDICLAKLTNDNIIDIPFGDRCRGIFFSDPLFGIYKNILIKRDGFNDEEYGVDTRIIINILDNSISVVSETDINNKISNLHSKLRINYGSFQEEFPEQKMVVKYLTGKEKVLEVGGNVGRNSLIIASILEKSDNLVVLESDDNISNQLIENRNLNNFQFHIENSALSVRKLIQKGWDTMPSEVLLDGYKWVNNITFEEIKRKYNIEFDTLVLDCEGAFYYILMDMPEILDNIKLIIMENDYHDITHKQYIDNILQTKNFYVHYVESGGWGCCRDNFFEVWKKRN